MSYSECESMCDNNPDCFNFEYCPLYDQRSDPPVPKMCRIFKTKILDAEDFKQVPWYDCSAYYTTCKKGTLTSMNITKNSIFFRGYAYAAIIKILFCFFCAARNADYCKEELEACGFDLECIAKVLKNCPGKKISSSL